MKSSEDKIKDLHVDLSGHKEDNKSLKRENARLKEENQSLQVENAQLKRKLENNRQN